MATWGKEENHPNWNLYRLCVLRKETFMYFVFILSCQGSLGKYTLFSISLLSSLQPCDVGQVEMQ